MFSFSCRVLAVFWELYYCAYFTLNSIVGTRRKKCDAVDTTSTFSTYNILLESETSGDRSHISHSHSHPPRQSICNHKQENRKIIMTSLLGLGKLTATWIIHKYFCFYCGKPTFISCSFCTCNNEKWGQYGFWHYLYFCSQISSLEIFSIYLCSSERHLFPKLQQLASCVDNSICGQVSTVLGVQ